MEAPEVSCPQCKSNSYINPGIKIFVSPCYHSLCEMCLSRLFVGGPNACPECGVMLRRSNYTSQTFEDVSVERECRIRKMVGAYFGKTLDDYSDEEEYNEHLEKIEDVVEELMEVKGVREMSQKLQEIKERPGMGQSRKKRQNQEISRKRKEEPYATPKQKKPKYFFDPATVAPDLLPPCSYFMLPEEKRDKYARLAQALIRKAAASLHSLEL